MTDFIAEIQAAAVNLGESIQFVCYEHQVTSLADVARQYGLAYALEQVADVYDSSL